MPPTFCWTPTPALWHTLVRQRYFQPAPHLIRQPATLHRSAPACLMPSLSLRVPRTTYKDDIAWEGFKACVQEWTCESQPSRPGEEEVPAAVATLDGASREQLRRRFCEWRTTAVRAGNPRRNPDAAILSWRYLYFVQVDEDSLSSVMQWIGQGPLDVGCVYLVRCYDEYDFGRPPEKKQEK
ncbi:hypothetical protein N657DRAFT_679297 [Parathielavia appendiculata]|uniref:Uncharacterized protein n=1 Tax=Parathielavia appendiculata TaxID=2587402 RepID=A0AAN6U4K6_9PEZI|nr:hypothetical protein N657DRAFT_679297 [Parathielavia appendiculata]